MSNALNPVIDVAPIMNDIAKQATGRTDLTVLDTTSFVSVGETVLRTGYENTLKAISQVLSRTIFSTRPWTSRLMSLRVTDQQWGGMTRKIMFLSKAAEKSENWNTDLSPDQLADGKSIDMYKINAPKAVQLNFYGTKTLQRHITRFYRQLTPAFTGPGELMAFIDGFMREFYNDIETDNEDETRLLLLNHMAGLVAMDSSTVIDLIAQYNLDQGTTYTRQEVLRDHFTSFMQFMVAEIKTISDRMQDRSALYHANLTKYEPVLRHTPKSLQRLILYAPFFNRAEASVFSQIFNPGYLSLGRNFDTVNYWQNQKEPTSINIKPNILDVNTGESKYADAAVSLPYVLGILFDRDTMGVAPRFDHTLVTPVNAAGDYYNIYYHWAFNAYSDYTENAFLFILGDGGTPSESDIETSNMVGKVVR